MLKLTCVFLAICMALLAASHATEAAVACTQVEESLKPCMPHLRSSGGAQATPPSNCCAGVKSVSALAQSTGEHKAVCECMRATASRTTGINYELAAKLPSQCGVTMSYTFSPNTDCSKVKA